MSENIFGGDPTTPATPTQDVSTPAVDPFTPLLADIKGDDGGQKYKDVPTALGALKHSQEYIKQLKEQLETANAKASQAVTMEQVLEQLNKEKKPDTPPVAPSTGLTADDVIRILHEKDAKEKAKVNTAKVAQKFKELHGEKAEEAFYASAASMGLTKEAINSLAASSPSAVFSMFGIKEASATPVSPSPSGINTLGMQDTSPQPLGTVMGFKKDKEIVEYWAKLKAEVNKSLGTE